MTNKLTVLVSCELSKIFSQRKYRIYPIIVSLLVVGGALLGMIPGNALSFTLANYTYTVLSLLCYVFAPIGIFMLASDLIGSELSSGTIDVLFTRAPRGGVLLGKAAAIACYTALLFASQLVLSTVISLLGGGVFTLFTSIAAYAVGLVPMLALASMAVLVAALTRSGSSAFAVNILLYLGSGVLGFVLSGLSPALFTSYLGLGGLVIGSTLPVSSLLVGLGVCGGTVLALLCMAGLRFANVEV